MKPVAVTWHAVNISIYVPVHFQNYYFTVRVTRYRFTNQWKATQTAYCNTIFSFNPKTSLLKCMILYNTLFFSSCKTVLFDPMIALTNIFYPIQVPRLSSWYCNLVVVQSTPCPHVHPARTSCSPSAISVCRTITCTHKCRMETDLQRCT